MNLALEFPTDGSAVPALSRKTPLVLAPFLGQTVLEHALAGLASEGVKRVRIEAGDQAEQIQRVVGQGEAWGLALEVSSALGRQDGLAPARVLTLDQLPQLPQQPLWRNYRDWFSAQQALMPVLARQRVGTREVSPGVFIGLRSRIAADARMSGPCWIGASVFVGPGAIIGPGTVIEDGSYVDAGAEIVGSIIGPQTYVGAFTEVRDSFAWGNELLHLDTGSLTKVADRFLLGELQVRRNRLGGLIDIIRNASRRFVALTRDTKTRSSSRQKTRLRALEENLPATALPSE